MSLYAAPPHIQRLLDKLSQVRSTGNNKWRACCPAHDDRHPSLDIAIGEKGSTLITCRSAGCDWRTILDAVGLQPRDLWPESRGAAARSIGSVDSYAMKRQSPCTTRYEVRDAQGQLCGVHVRTEFLKMDGSPYRPKQFRWEQHAGRSPISMPLYHADELAKAPRDVPVWLVEGERKAGMLADALRRAGEPGVVVGTVTGASTIPSDGSLRALLGRKVILWPDSDPPGEKHMRRIAERLVALGVEDVVWLRWPDAHAKEDAADFVANGGAVADLIAWMGPVPDSTIADYPGDTGTSTQLMSESKVGILLADVMPQHVEWLWERRIPLGKITILDGDPGLGKSLLTLDLAARVSRHRDMPDGTAGVDGGVVLLSVEDGLADTIRPRLDAAGADLHRILALPSIDSEEPGRWERPITLPRDLVSLEQAIAQVDARLVVIDPLMAYLDSHVNSYRDQDVRQALAPLAQLAARSRAAIVIVRHPTKGGTTNAVYRGGGSIGIIGAARSALLVAKDPDEPERERVLASSKSNLGPPVPSWRYCIAESDTGVPRIQWLGECAMSADGLLVHAVANAEKSSALEEAVEWLSEALRDGPLPSKVVERRAGEMDIRMKTLRKAQHQLGIKPTRNGFGEGSQWIWALPMSDDPKPNLRSFPDDPEDALTDREASSALVGQLRGDVTVRQQPLPANSEVATWTC